MATLLGQHIILRLEKIAQSISRWVSVQLVASLASENKITGEKNTV